jgi:hypothetical protein
VSFDGTSSVSVIGTEAVLVINGLSATGNCSYFTDVIFGVQRVKIISNDTTRK